MLSRICWFWPEPVAFALGSQAPATGLAAHALDRLRLLDLVPGATPEDRPCPVMVALEATALPRMEAFAREMQKCQRDAAGLMRSAYGKARGTALRLALVLEYLWWCGRSGMVPPPATISERAFLGAETLVADYLMPMAERVYGDADCPVVERNAATPARWIVKTRPAEVHIRQLQREARLPGLRDAEAIRAAAAVLVDAGWLREPAIGFGVARKVAYPINAALREASR